MHTRACLVGLLVALSSLAAAVTPAQAELEDTPRILVICSFQQAVPWTRKLIGAIESTVVAEPRSIQLQVDYLHWKRVGLDPEYLEDIYRLYRKEFKPVRFNVVVAVGDIALATMLRYGDRLFPGTPVVFCGATMATSAAARKRALFTGEAADWHLADNIRLAMRLFPRARRVVFFHDQTASALQFAADARSVGAEFPALRFAFLTRMTLAEVLARVRRLPSDAVLIPLAFTIDKSGSFYVGYDAHKAIVSASSVPAIGLFDYSLETGVVGGWMLDEAEVGRAAAKTALRIAYGADVRKMRERPRTQPHYIFDFERMRRFRLSRSNLPAGSVVLHEPPGFFRLHGTVVAVAGGVVALTLAVFGGLRVRDGRRRCAEAAQLESERRTNESLRRFFRDTVRSVTDGKLEICDASELDSYPDGASVCADLRGPADVPAARDAIRESCRAAGLDDDALSSFTIAVGEAMTNAVKHAPAGRAYTGVEAGSVWTAVFDNGPGIDSVLLPRAALLRGFSTKGSMGLGFSIMLDAADRILLATGSEGTRIVLVKGIAGSVDRFSLEDIPDQWEESAAD